VKIKRSNLEWNVIHYDWSKKKVITYNIMPGIAELVAKEIRRGNIQNKADLKKELTTEFMYHYWSKCEAEMFVSGFGRNDEPEKVDIWQQIEMNLDRIVDYVNIQCDLKLN
jgi:hypothetical protein